MQSSVGIMFYELYLKNGTLEDTYSFISGSAASPPASKIPIILFTTSGFSDDIS